MASNLHQKPLKQMLHKHITINVQQILKQISEKQNGKLNDFYFDEEFDPPQKNLKRQEKFYDLNEVMDKTCFDEEKLVVKRHQFGDQIGTMNCIKKIKNNK